MRVVIFVVFFYFVKCQDYRLPETIVPSKYVVDLFFNENVFTGIDTAFQGEVTITFEVTESTSEIKLHYRDTNLTSYSLTSSSGDMGITFDDYNSTTEIVTFIAETALAVGTIYELNIEFQNTLRKDAMNGVYVSTYEKETGETAYLVLSKFEPVHARHAFPCFDAPQFKATFALSLTFPPALNALANSIVETSDLVTIDNVSYNKTNFQETTIMPPYLLAFLISDFTCTEGDTIETGVSHSVCSRSQEQSHRGWALEIGTTVLRSMESMFGIKYGTNMPKMHQLGIPDFASGAMENWGIVSYRETYVLYDEDNSSLSYKKSVATVVAHEFAHMWFGNLVTCKWWDYTFLNEGFASYFEYFGPTAVKATLDWELDRIFNVEVVHTALLADSVSSALSLTSTSSSPTDISGKFGTISYNKGAAILRMIEKNIMGADNFIYGIREYLETYQYQATIPSQLWGSFAGHVPAAVLPNDVTFEEVLNNWVELSGHPVVFVSKNGDDIVLTQSRFLLSGSEETARQYYVPVTYTLSNDTTTSWNTTVKLWLIPGEASTTISGALESNDWVVLNNRQASFYRVEYDSALKSALLSQLHSNHLKIDVLNRAQLISDSYNFARSGTTGGYGNWTYADAMEVLSYLYGETDYYPWYATVVGNNYLLQKLGYESDIGKRFIAWMLELMEEVYESVSFDVTDDTNMIYSLKQSTLLNRICKYGEANCVANALQLFADWRDNEVSVPKNLRTVVYCNGLRYSNNTDRDFNFLWNKYTQNSLMTETITLYAGLSCAEDTTLLKWYLRQTINSTVGIRLQDFTTVWSYVYSSSKTGTEAALEFIAEEYDDLAAYYSSVGSLISGAANYIYDEAQIEKLEALSAVSIILENHNSTIQSAIATARSNIAWAQLAGESIASYLDSQDVDDDDTSAAATFTVFHGFIIVFLYFSLRF